MHGQSATWDAWQVQGCVGGGLVRKHAHDHGVAGAMCGLHARTHTRMEAKETNIAHTYNSHYHEKGCLTASDTLPTTETTTEKPHAPQFPLAVTFATSTQQFDSASPPDTTLKMPAPLATAAALKLSTATAVFPTATTFHSVTCTPTMAEGPPMWM